MALPSISLKKIVDNTNGYGSRLAFSPDGHLLTVVNSAGALYVWRDLTPWQTQSRPGELLDRSIFSAMGDRIFAAPQVFQINTEQWLPFPSVVKAFTADLAEGDPPGGFAAYASAWSLDGRDLVVYGEYRPSRRLGDRDHWNGPSKRLLLLDGQTRQLKSILWEGNGSEAYRTIALSERFIAAAAIHLRVWDRQTQQAVADLGEHTLVIRDLQWNATGTLLASGGADQQVILWDTSTWKSLHRWQAHRGDVKALAFHPHYPLLVTGGDDQQIKFWSLEGKLIKAEAVQGIVEGLAFNPKGDQLAIALGEPQFSVRVYQVQVQETSD
ncbi:WD40 repeat domain-containing protein [Leptolyngbyaceae cyanobacterium UHCC 1019]